MAANRQIYTQITDLLSQIRTLQDLYNYAGAEKTLLDFAKTQPIPLGNTIEAIFFELKHYLSIVESSKGELDLYTLINGSDFKTEITLPSAVIANQEDLQVGNVSTETGQKKLSLREKIAVAQKNFTRLQRIQQNLNRSQAVVNNISDQIKTYDPKETTPLPQSQKTISEVINQLPETKTLESSLKLVIASEASVLLSANPSLSPAVAIATAVVNNLNQTEAEAYPLAQEIENAADYDTIEDRTQKEITKFNRFVENSSDINDISKPLISPVLNSVEAEQFLNLIAQDQLIIDPSGGLRIESFPSPSASQVSGIIKTLSQNPNQPTAIATEIYSRISPESLTLALEYGLENPSTPLGQFINSHYQSLSRFVDSYQTIHISQLGNDLRSENPQIHTAPPTPSNITHSLRQNFQQAQSYLSKSTQIANRVSPHLTQKWQVFIARASNNAPGISRALGVISNPIGAARSWAQNQIGTRLSNWAMKELGGEALKNAAKEVTQRILTEGAKKAAAQVAKVTAKQGLKVAIESTAQLVDAIPGGVVVGLVIAVAVEIAFKLYDVTIGFVKKNLDNVWQSLGWGEEFKSRDLIAPAATAALIAGLLVNLKTIALKLRAAALAATASALLIVAIATVVTTLFFIIPAVIVGPLLSTFVHLESQPRNDTSLMCEGYTPETGQEKCKGNYCFPVNDISKVAYDEYHHDYPANDIFRIGDKPGSEDDKPLTLVAYTSGTVIWISENDSLGGHSFIIAGTDGFFYYYAHNACNLVTLGQTVAAGDPVGVMDSSGNAEGTPEHLHFQISDQADMTTIPENYPHFIPPWEDFCRRLGMCGPLNPGQNPDR